MRDCVVAVFGVILFSASVICKGCVTFDFEDGIDGHFISDRLCVGLDMWVEKTYSSLSMESPHAKSNHFISPTSDLSCVNSFSFAMSPTGVLEVNAFMKSSNSFDQISVLVFEIVPGGNDGMVGNAILSPALSGFVEGWNKLRIPTVNQRNFNGYITLMGMAASNSIVLIDSFRYYMQPSDEDLCQIYDDNETTTTTKLVSTTALDFDPTTEADIESTTDITVGSTTETDFKSTTDTDGGSTTETDFKSTTDTDVGSTTIDPTSTETNDWSSTESVTVTDQTTSGDTTEKPDDEIPNDDDECWTTLTIVLIILISNSITAFVFYRIGRGRVKRSMP